MNIFVTDIRGDTRELVYMLPFGNGFNADWIISENPKYFILITRYDREDKNNITLRVYLDKSHDPIYWAEAFSLEADISDTIERERVIEDIYNCLDAVDDIEHIVR